METFRRVQLQFFLSYGVIGSVMPMLAIFLTKEKGFTRSDIGTAMALMSVASLLSPVALTLLADARFDSRRLLAGGLAASGITLSLLLGAQTVGSSLVFLGIYGLALVAVIPLQDGYFFSAAKLRERHGGRPLPYPRVRVWGTIGFIVPSVVFASMGAPIRAIIILAIAYCAISAVNALRLPATPRKATLPAAPGQENVLPTMTALRALFGPRGRAFCIALALAHAATTAFYAFFPLYLEEIAEVEQRWIGLIINYGVFLEIFFTLALPWMQRRLGMKRLFLIGFAVMSARMLVLALEPPIAVVVLAQTFHGVEIIALFILPVIYLNSLAGDEFRNSIQGVYAMLVAGVAKIAGYQVAGRIADSGAAGGHDGLITLFQVGSGIGAAAFVVMLLFFREPPRTS